MDELKTTYNHKNPLVRAFFKTKLSLAIRLADLKKSDLILDFGCGAGYLKNKLRKKGFRVIGYDITPEHSDIGDYRKIKANKIFVLDVFEHIPKKEIKEILRNFKNSGRFELTTIIPTENWLSRKIRKMLGKDERVREHVTSLKEILEILKNELKLVKKINFLSISWIGRFRN